ncbi:MAG: alpha/beta fold hydrolase [Burkholderiales bacterium]|nr:alpha/beta fold hydrolase [Burkholderiales bacterium]
MTSTPPLPNGIDFDKEFRAQIAKLTGGLSPKAFSSAWADWAAHLALSPSRQFELRQELISRTADTWEFALKAMTGAPVAPNDGFDGTSDPRFGKVDWSQWPFNVYARAYQNSAALVNKAVEGVPGVDPYQEKLVQFSVRMLLDASAPSNYLGSNPELLALTQSEKGQNLVRGVKNWLKDLKSTLNGAPPEGTDAFEVGKTVAVTPGKVIFRNDLIELIQYSPTTKTTHAEPLLIVPAWIMKYYILDLSPKNSLVKFLVDQGHTVFMISWKNPSPADRDVCMDDYLNKGFRAALDAVTAVVPNRKVHSVGYCIGGTLLSIGAAMLAHERDQRLASVTLFAAQADFSEPGELAYFINASQLAMLEATMYKKGVLESAQMGGAFALLRSKDLIWQPIINNYLKGQRDTMIDLMAWNADGTRMPYRMHTEYLNRLYLNNDLATNKFSLNGQVITLSDISVPMFVVGTEADHVAPWTSVYKIGNLVRSDDYSFLLTSGGHNAGIIAGPVHPKRHFRLKTKRLKAAHIGNQEWLQTTEKQQGSWWPAWQQWLQAHSSGQTKPPPMGAPRKGYPSIGDAPGNFVKQR